MATLTYLFRQDGRYYFRRRIPSDLGAVIGKKEIKISLGAGIGVSDAKTRAIQLSAIYHDYFIRLRGGNNQIVETDRLKQRIKDIGNNRATMPANPIATISTLPTISDFIPTFIKEKSKGWGESTRRHNLFAINLFVKILGDKSLGDYTRHDIVDFMATLERVHKSYGKSYKDESRTIEQILDIATTKPKMVITTLVNHLRSVKAVFKCANQYHDARINLEQLFGGLDFGKDVRQPDRRIPWSVDNLNRLFNTPIWTGTSQTKCSLRYKTGNLIIKDAYWWLPVIAIFSGMRLEEVCQLQCGDLKVDGDIQYLDVSEGAGKHLKTATSARQVPLHGTLADLGIVALFDGNTPTRRIFGDLTRGGVDKKLGYRYSANFARYRHKTDIHKDWMDYHSFRHTFVSALWQATRDMVLVASIVGHGGKNQSQTADYTHIDLATKADAVNKLTYDGLEMAHLK